MNNGHACAYLARLSRCHISAATADKMTAKGSHAFPSLPLSVPSPWLVIRIPGFFNTFRGISSGIGMQNCPEIFSTGAATPEGRPIKKQISAAETLAQAVGERKGRAPPPRSLHKLQFRNFTTQLPRDWPGWAALPQDTAAEYRQTRDRHFIL
ncbi:hypothetical protein NDU88_003292 [Pleurodeles waltl]|uniref:Uncharacterized protein n=1 Tax=Pleurodeles waltl TaxID=8319 RepID=A0AAV7QEI5_PLEWA|nr:hypothetical protein NDU88_003292 [Pleurodeles waltl]